MKTTLLAQPTPPLINGRAAITCTSYRLDIDSAGGKRIATGQMVFAVLEHGPEFDIAALCREPFHLRLCVGAMNYALDDCVAGEPFECRETLVEGEWVAVDMAKNDILFGVKFRSEKVSPLSAG